MVRNNFIFFNNINSRYLNMFFLDYIDFNFVFFKKFNNLSNKTILINLQKINCNKQCVNILYF